MRKFVFGLIAAILSTAAPLSQAQVPGIQASYSNALRAPQCTPKITPYAATYYPKVVMVGDSITQHDHSPGLVNSVTNGTATTGSFTTTSGSPIILYNGGDVAALGTYRNQAITGTGIAGGTLILGALDSTHLLLSANATSSATNTLSLASPQIGAQAQWNLAGSFIGELPNVQASAPYFRFDQWNDFTRNWGATGNTAAMMRGGNLGYSGASTADLLPRMLEYQQLDPDILIISVGINNITSSTFQADLAREVDIAHAWCPSLPIFLTNLRATGASIVSSRQPGGIVYDNTLIDAIVTARPWLTKIDLFTPYASNASPSAGVAIAGIFGLTSGNATVTVAAGNDARQIGVQVGQTVSGNANVTGSPTVATVSASSFTLSSGAAVTGNASNQSLTFTPFAFANQTGNDINYTVTYPTGAGDSLHPGVYGAQIAGAPPIQSAICSVIVGNCAASTTHNVFLDNPGASLLTTNPASLLTGTPANINKSISGSGVVNTTATWSTSGTTMTVASATGLTIGQAITSASGIAANTYVSNIAGTTVTFAPAATGNGTAQAVTFSPGVSGQTPQGMDLAQGANTFSSYISSVSANSETGGSMQTIVVYPSGSANSETLVIRPTAIAVAGTGCLGKWCQMWAEFEVDSNAGWVSITSKAQERLGAYSNNYYSQGAMGIIPPGGGGTHRFWAHTECYPYPFNSSGDSPNMTLAHAPSLDTGTPTIIFRRWDIRQCTPSPNAYKVQN